MNKLRECHEETTANTIALQGELEQKEEQFEENVGLDIISLYQNANNKHHIIDPLEKK